MTEKTPRGTRRIGLAFARAAALSFSLGAVAFLMVRASAGCGSEIVPEQKSPPASVQQTGDPAGAPATVTSTESPKTPDNAEPAVGAGTPEAPVGPSPAVSVADEHYFPATKAMAPRVLNPAQKKPQPPPPQTPPQQNAAPPTQNNAP